MAYIHHLNGFFDDFVFGDPDSENTITGFGRGNDTLLGGNRNDIFQLNTDRSIDLVDGGAGRDRVEFTGGPAGLRIDLQSGIVEQFNDITSYDDQEAVYGWEEVALLINIEDVVGSFFNDRILGSAADNTIEGGYGADSINGAGGNDTASYEHSFAGVAVDLGGWSPFNDAIGPVGWGSGGDAEGDVLISIENVIGSFYGDWFSGNSANNVFNGGGGLDTVSYRDADEGVAINLQTGSVHGGRSVGNDTLISIEYVEGSRFNDTYEASNRSDVFVFGRNIGHDTIDGFNARDTDSNRDWISFEGIFSNWDELSQHITRNGDDWTITIDENNSITLTDVQGTLNVADFFH